MACGVPVIAANEGGPVEILGNRTPPSSSLSGVGGWLVPPRDTARLSDALRHALGSPREELSRIGRLGRLRAEDHFSARAFARGVAEVLWELD
jgi:glycosyltransferase involved in cell wall biosynthesis